MSESYPAEISVEEFAAATSDVPAEFIECGCGEEYIGDPDDEHICPECRIEQGRWPPWEDDR